MLLPLPSETGLENPNGCNGYSDPFAEWFKDSARLILARFKKCRVQKHG